MDATAEWWWSIFLWCLGQSVVNGYLVYKCIYVNAKVMPMSHLNFHVKVATAWCLTPMPEDCVGAREGCGCCACYHAGAEEGVLDIA